MGSSSSNNPSPECEEDENPDMPKPGDLIEIFQLWAVYVGKGFVVHFVTNGLMSSSASSRVPLPGQKGVVLREKLQDVVGGDKWRINNSLDKKYKARPVYDIVKDAIKLVDVPLLYNLVRHNCEHFATDLRYGESESRQVRNVAAGLAGTVTTVVLGALSLVGI